MAQLSLNKSTLSKEVKNLKNYQQFLPSLDLKRRKLLMVKMKAQKNFQLLTKEVDDNKIYVSTHFPMISVSDINLEDLVYIDSIDINYENIVGVKLPVLEKINFQTSEYSYFNTPHWLDNFIQHLKMLAERRVQINLAAERMGLLEKALNTVTQRKNLFEKVLIPKSKNFIRQIQIFLSDNERAAVVRSKIAKKKRVTK